LSLRSGSVTQGGHAVAPGGELAWDALLATAPGGRAQVQVGGQAVLLLKGGTQLRLTREGAAVMAELPHGTLFSAVLPGTAFGVSAGGARVDAHGTLFLVRHVADGRAYVCICRGSIQVRAPGLDRLLASADDAHETGLDLVLGAGRTEAAQAKPAYYTDEEEDGLKDALKEAAGGRAPKEAEED
jgi:ferric-dicitrate binding protein FerR (iron transport regulator)